jgi:hypothetical protein
MLVHEVLFSILLVEPNIITCHNDSEVYSYSCFIFVVERSASRSCQLALKVFPSDDVDPPQECAYWFSFGDHMPFV